MPCLAVCFMLILCYYIYQDRNQPHNIFVCNINFEFLLSCQQESNEEIHSDTYEYIAKQCPQTEECIVNILNYSSKTNIIYKVNLKNKVATRINNLITEYPPKPNIDNGSTIEECYVYNEFFEKIGKVIINRKPHKYTKLYSVEIAFYNQENDIIDTLHTSQTDYIITTYHTFAILNLQCKYCDNNAVYIAFHSKSILILQNNTGPLYFDLIKLVLVIG